MKIKYADNARYRNDEHFQFHTEVKDLIVAAGAGKMKIEDLFAVYLVCYANEDEAIMKISKSAITADIEKADRQRDATFRGFADTCRAALKHYDANVVAAAKRLKVLLDKYGNLAPKPMSEETAAIYNILQDLTTGVWAKDVEILGLAGWVNKLDADNNAFEALVRARYGEAATKTQLTAKETRAATDRAYSAMTGRINALIIVEGEKAYSEFVNKINVYIDMYNTALARRAGRRAAKKPDNT